MEEKKQRGGARKGAGRKSVSEEQKVNNLFVTALKELYNTEIEEQAKITFIKDTLMDSQRGQLFIAEHIFGKAPQEVTQTNFNIETKDLDDNEIKRIKDTLNDAY